MSEMTMYNGPGNEPWNLFSGADEIWELHSSGEGTKKKRQEAGTKKKRQDDAVDEECPASKRARLIHEESAFVSEIDSLLSEDDEEVDQVPNLEDEVQEIPPQSFYGILEQDLVQPQMQAQQFSGLADQFSDVSEFVYQQQEGYVPDLFGLEQQQASSSVPDPSLFEDVYFDIAGYFGECCGSEDQHQVAEYSSSGLKEDQEQQVVDYGLEQYQQQDAYVGECSGLEETKEEDLGILQCLMDSPVRPQLYKEWGLENLEDFFFMGESCQ